MYKWNIILKSIKHYGRSPTFGIKDSISFIYGQILLQCLSRAHNLAARLML